LKRFESEKLGKCILHKFKISIATSNFINLNPLQKRKLISMHLIIDQSCYCIRYLFKM